MSSFVSWPKHSDESLFAGEAHRCVLKSVTNSSVNFDSLKTNLTVRHHASFCWFLPN